MKRIACIWLGGTILAAMVIALAGAQDQPLGDYARTVRKQKDAKQQAAAKQFDNDNLPRTDKLSVVGNAPPEPEQPAKTDDQAQASGDQAQTAAQSQPKPEDASEKAKERQKSYDDWKEKIATQKDSIDLLARELDVLNREYRLRAAAFYADAGNRLRNSGQWDTEDKNYKQQIAQKQKALDDAKQKLDDLQESARKAGVPSSVRE